MLAKLFKMTIRLFLQRTVLIGTLSLLTGCGPDTFLATAQQEEKDNQHLIELLKNTILEEVKFDDLSAPDALISLLNQANAKLGQDQIQYVIGTRAEGDTTKIKIFLKQVPVMEALRFLTALSPYRFAFRRGRLLIFCGHLQSEDVLTYRVYTVPASYFNRATPSSSKEDVTSLLRECGVDFSEGTQAFYFPSKRLLVVRNEPQQLDLIGELLKEDAKTKQGD